MMHFTIGRPFMGYYIVQLTLSGSNIFGTKDIYSRQW